MNRELTAYITANILPQYEAFTDGHDRRHVEMVIRESLNLAKSHGAQEDMCYAIAAYHDLGMPQGRALHHMTSAALLASDPVLRRWFTPEQIRIMKEAVEDHRASAEEAPRSLYGCIVADADHFVEPENVLRRTIAYGKANHPDLTARQQIEHAREHVERKYCQGGYLRYHLNDPRSLQGLQALRELAKDGARFEEHCARYL